MDIVEPQTYVLFNTYPKNTPSKPKMMTMTAETPPRLFLLAFLKSSYMTQYHHKHKPFDILDDIWGKVQSLNGRSLVIIFSF